MELETISTEKFDDKIEENENLAEYAIYENYIASLYHYARSRFDAFKDEENHSKYVLDKVHGAIFTNLKDIYKKDDRNDISNDNMKTYMTGLEPANLEGLKELERYVKDDLGKSIELQSTLMSKRIQISKKLAKLGIDSKEIFDEEGDVRAQAKDTIDHSNKLIRAKDFKKILMERFFELYEETPSSGFYIDRIVRNMTSEWDQDSVQVAIVKQFYKYTGYKKGNLGKYIQYYFTPEEKKTFAEMEKKERDQFILDHITDELIDHASTLRAIEALRSLAEDNGCTLSSSLHDELKQKTGLQTNDDASLIDGLSSFVNDDIDQLVKRIRKELSGQIAKFNDKYKDKAEIPALIDIAITLSKGIFKQSNKTKDYLYRFALAFGLRYYPQGEAYGTSDDLVKNLFYDYYNENVKKYLSDEKNNGGYEKETLGIGPGYKNYKELVYLYYSTKDLSAKDKIKKADNMCKALKKYGKEHNQEEALLKNKTVFTKQYKDAFDQHLNDDEETFMTYLEQNYVTNTTLSTGDAMIGYDQVTAKKVYQALVDMIIMTFVKRGYVKGDRIEDLDHRNTDLLNVPRKYKYDILRDDTILTFEDYGKERDQGEGISEKSSKLFYKIASMFKYYDAIYESKMTEADEGTNDHHEIDQEKNDLETGKEKATQNIDPKEPEVDEGIKGYSSTYLQECLKLDLDNERVTRTKMIVVYYYLFHLYVMDQGKSFKQLMSRFFFGFRIDKLYTNMKGVTNDYLQVVNSNSHFKSKKENTEMSSDQKKKKAYNDAVSQVNLYIDKGLDYILDICGFAPFNHKYFFDDFVEMILWYSTCDFESDIYDS